MPSIYSFYTFQHVDVFVYELGVKSKDDLGKRAKIDVLSMTTAEWGRVHDLCSLLGVRELSFFDM